MNLYCSLKTSLLNVFVPAFLILLFTISLSGCTVVSVVDATASTVVDVTAGAVKVTGKVIGGAIDAVTPDSDD